MTISTLMKKNQEQATVTALKKAYSMLSSAYTLAVQDNGNPDSWGMYSATAYYGPSADIMINKIKPYLKYTKSCNHGVAGCMSDAVVRQLSNTDWMNFNGSSVASNAKLQDGTSLSAVFESGNCNLVFGPTPALQTVCGHYYIDINGDKGPAQMGRDIFPFMLTNYGIVPEGSAAQTNYTTFAASCKINGSGSGCTAWIIYNENMEYLKCSPPTLAWGGATTCP